jgi:hypothetical protein
VLAGAAVVLDVRRRPASPAPQSRVDGGLLRFQIIVYVFAGLASEGRLARLASR